MRVHTQQTEVFQFDELSQNAQENAIANCRYFEVDGEWWDSVYEDAAMVGIKITSFDIDRNRHADVKISDVKETAQQIVDQHGESCETYKTASAYLAERDALVDEWVKDENGEFVDEYELDSRLDELDEEFKKSIAEDYAIMLQREYEYLTSDEAVTEGIHANEYEFTEDGELF
jgi:thiamine pyrophosphate-dependent acetolactate synthase large subunit-like protein